MFATSRRWSTAELEEFGRRPARGRFEREDLQANLAGAEVPATRVVDNVGFFHAGRDPQAVDDQLLYDRC